MELVDLFPTITDLVGVPLPQGEALDGQSLAGVIAGSSAPLARQYALSVYPRCPANENDPSNYWQENDCLMVERSAFFSLGISIRTPRWRYTEWARWNGTKLAPEWDAPLLGAELYDHLGDDGTSFDAPFEVVNLADDPAQQSTRASLSTLLRAAYGDAPWPVTVGRREQ